MKYCCAGMMQLAGIFLVSVTEKKPPKKPLEVLPQYIPLKLEWKEK